MSCIFFTQTLKRWRGSSPGDLLFEIDDFLGCLLLQGFAFAQNLLQDALQLVTGRLEGLALLIRKLGKFLVRKRLVILQGHDHQLAASLAEQETDLAGLFLQGVESLLHVILEGRFQSLFLLFIITALECFRHGSTQLAYQLIHVLLELPALAGWQRDGNRAFDIGEIIDITPVIRYRTVRSSLGDAGIDISRLACPGLAGDKNIVSWGVHRQAELHRTHSPVLADHSFQSGHICTRGAKIELSVQVTDPSEFGHRNPETISLFHDDPSLSACSCRLLQVMPGFLRAPRLSQTVFQPLVQDGLGLLEWNGIRKIQRFPADDLPV